MTRSSAPFLYYSYITSIPSLPSLCQAGSLLWPGSGYSGWILEGQEGDTGKIVDHANLDTDVNAYAKAIAESDAEADAQTYAEADA